MLLKTKKSISLLTAGVLSLSLCSAALAAPEPLADDAQISVTVTIVNDTVEGGTFSKEVAVPAGSSVYEVLNAYNKEAGYWIIDGTFYDDYKDGKPTGTQSWYLNSMTYDVDGTARTFATEPAAEAPDEFEGDPDDWYNGYGLVFADPEENEYTYFYAGYAWTYAVEGASTEGQNVNDLTMNKYILGNKDTVTLTYTLQTSQWTQDKPYTDEAPYLPENPPKA